MYKYYLLAGLLFVGTANAGFIEFNDRSSFESFLAGPTTIDFEAYEIEGGFNYVDPLTDSGVTFDNTGNNYLYVASDTAVNPAYQWNSGANLLFGNEQEGALLDIFLPGNIFAVGFDFMMQSDSQRDAGVVADFDINIDGTNFVGTSQNRPNRSFFGVISDTQISGLQISVTNPENFRSLGLIDNFTFATETTSVPEPTSIAILALGLAGLGLSRRKVKA